jgi:hypothetical protein
MVGQLARPSNTLRFERVLRSSRDEGVSCGWDNRLPVAAYLHRPVVASG